MYALVHLRSASSFPLLAARSVSVSSFASNVPAEMCDTSKRIVFPCMSGILLWNQLKVIVRRNSSTRCTAPTLHVLRAMSFSTNPRVCIAIAPGVCYKRQRKGWGSWSWPHDLLVAWWYESWERGLRKSVLLELQQYVVCRSDIDQNLAVSLYDVVKEQPWLQNWIWLQAISKPLFYRYREQLAYIILWVALWIAPQVCGGL